ncbi:MAG: VOC family protein [Microcella sp.]
MPDQPRATAPPTLLAELAMGAVTLDVANIETMTAYYRDAVGLEVLAETADTVTLGRPASVANTSDGTIVTAAQPAVVLRHSPAMRHAGPREAGLFHTAILFESRAALAAAVYRTATAHPERFTGSADHLVSEAFYFDDPEGNGVELYWDRPRDAWQWSGDRVAMASLPLDPNAFLRAHLSDDALDHPTAGAVGHVHLSVGDVDTARSFYSGMLGFDVTAELGNQAVFMSAGGYHHHMAMNVWRSRGAGRRRQATLGLGLVDIVLPSADAVGALTERMRDHRIQLADDGQTVTLDDPWGNMLRVTATP